MPFGPKLLVTELCVLRTFEGVDFSLIFVCAQYVPEFLWDRLRASIQFPVMLKRAQYARFSGDYVSSPCLPSARSPDESATTTVFLELRAHRMQETHSVKTMCAPVYLHCFLQFSGKNLREIR
eukprot:COSAG02_NODE_2775_length_8040_cov_9.109365_8_plen_123_part_00